MKSSSLASLLLSAASAMAASSELPTLTSTIISSTCTSFSRAYYGNSTSFTSSTPDSTLYETDVVTNENTLTMLQTTCIDDECYVKTVLNTLTTVVATVDGILTTYVTAKPVTLAYNNATTSTLGLSTTESETASAAATAVATITSAPAETSSSEESTEGEFGTTVVTITSCSENKCSETAVTTGFTVGTTTVDGVKTIYTTYCPLSDEATSKAYTPATTVVTITSCSDNKCSETAVTTGVSVGTTTVNGKETVYTTYCPLSVEATSSAYTPATTVVTITSCSDNKCSETAVTTGVSVGTTTVNGEETVYTTYCPLSGKTTSTSVSTSSSTEAVTTAAKKTTVSTSEAAEDTTEGTTTTSSTVTTSSAPSKAATTTEIQTTVITLTSCKHDKCSTTPVTTGVSHITTTISGTETIYTTYCPLSSVSTSSLTWTTPTTSITSTTSTSSTSSTSSTFTTVLAESTVNVITNNIITQSKTTSIASSTSVAEVSTYEGAAAHVLPAVLALPVVYMLL